MEVFHQGHTDALVTRIKSLESSRKALLEGEEDVIESIKRVVQSLRSSGEIDAFPRIDELATAVENATKEELPAQLDNLLNTLSEIVSETESDKINILVVDDDPTISLLLKKKLSTENREVLIAETGTEAEKILNEREVSLIILDLFLPDIDGRTVLLHLRERPQTSRIPVVVLSARESSQTKTECFALGADEYFVKPFDPEVLVVSISAKLQRTKEISREAQRDSLTRLPNRSAFNSTFERMRSFANRVGAPLSVGMLDIDRFKSINDTYGHTMGDEVLQRIASVINKSLRKYDSLFRWGGEEFVVILPNTGTSGGVRALEKALQAVSEERFTSSGAEIFVVTFSAGVTEVTQDSTMDEIIEEADRLLYKAKSSGRNRVMCSGTSIESFEKKVLMAEDDKLIAKIVKYRLEQEGFHVYHYLDGLSALSAAKENSANLAIIDVKMPEMDGFELLRNLRMLPTFSHTPIMMVTSMGREQDIVRGFKLGADDYVLKPFSMVELLARIRRLLTRI